MSDRAFLGTYHEGVFRKSQQILIQGTWAYTFLEISMAYR